ncbi:MAG: hypothetical protein AAFV07_10505 [Bacteroidota bacterium]
MLHLSSRLPFSIDDVYGGFAQVTGILTAEEDAIFLEYQTQDNILGGLIKSSTRELMIPLQELDSVEARSKWTGTRFFIRVRRLASLDGLPNVENGEVKLKIKRKNKEVAISMASRINLRISELRLDPSERGDSFL